MMIYSVEATYTTVVKNTGYAMNACNNSSRSALRLSIYISINIGT